MSDKNHILRQAKSDIYNALEGIIKFYNMKGASYSALKKYYKKKTNFDEILEDIRNKAINLFDDEKHYKKFVKEILMDMLDDRIAHEKDKNKITEMKHLKAFENYGGKLMWVVYVDDEKHSAWDSEDEAEHQVSVLEDNGYSNVYYDEDEVEDWVENGHYYV